MILKFKTGRALRVERHGDEEDSFLPYEQMDPEPPIIETSVAISGIHKIYRETEYTYVEGLNDDGPTPYIETVNITPDAGYATNWFYFNGFIWERMEIRDRTNLSACYPFRPNLFYGSSPGYVTRDFMSVLQRREWDRMQIVDYSNIPGQWATSSEAGLE